MIAKTRRLPARSQVKPADTWDLSSLFGDDAAWEEVFTEWEERIGGYEAFRGKLASSPEALAECLRFDTDFEFEGERLGTYAFLKTAEDTANSTYQRMIGRYRNVASRAAQAASYIRPEIMAIPTKSMERFLEAAVLSEFRLLLEQLLRFKPHTLGNSEEKLLAMQSEMAEASNQIFRQLTDADLKWGSVRNEDGELVELSHATFSVLLQSPDRNVRRKAFLQYYSQFAAHENTLAATLAGSVQRDVYYARARAYPSALAASLFHDKVPVTVVDNLIASVHRHLPALYRYYDLRRRKMRLREIHHYDTYVPILSELKTRHTWNDAVKLVISAIEPLGDEYCAALEHGLKGRWCDRYPNQGKQSGAFSSGSYEADPYILMNYQPDVLDHVFTLAHEAGHSMHSYYSARHQPFQYYSYAIFVAEVASTFNEQLLARHMMRRAKTDKERAFLINREIDSIRATIIRQTMFAEFEGITHALVETGEVLTLERTKSEYRKLLELYFGADFAIDPELSLECFRIPHFYRAFYVYKYATGLSAAIALAERVTAGGPKELQAYLGFLKAGCSKYPLDILRDAGVDMEQPGPVDTALDYFERLVAELDELL
ncbi:MAG TPA: oligoendopeptidase F [Pirellulales bacterium]|jgi:oligoendopeptidase F|nr:oligoendopeptidase F [Pirellulales bacterium]